jgi:hypothetical protein
MPDLPTGTGTPRRLRAARHRPRRTSILLIAAAAGLATVAVVDIERGRVERATPAPPPPPPAPGAVVRDVPADLWFGMAGPSAETFSRPAGAALPDLNADARAILDDLDGGWTDGQTRLHIDARRRLAFVGRGAMQPPQPLVVRDIGAAMIVADIGPQRFVLLRRPEGVALAGATLPAPVELRRE